MPRPKRTGFNNGIFVGCADSAMPKSSWWLGLSREGLATACKQELTRMTNSRYGRRETLPEIGGVDPKAGLLYARYSKAPGVVPNE